jgi:alkylation response protein AidB-like acyl-CoA dehydrogenase
MSTNTFEMHSFIDTAHAYAAKSVAAIFDGERADGALEKMDDVLATAFAIGLAASPDPNQPGYDYGIWGAALSETGLAPSALMLSAVAEVCGGVALNLHVQGLASQVIALANRKPASPPQRVAPAIQEEFGLPGWGTLNIPTLDAPAHIISQAKREKNGYLIDGLKPFMYAMPGAEAAVVFCRVDDNWGCFLIPLTSPGLKTEMVGVRTGLRASYLNHLTLKGVQVPLDARLDEGDALPLLMRTLSLNWLGLAAIGAGIARGAVKAARKYASELYQC